MPGRTSKEGKKALSREPLTDDTWDLKINFPETFGRLIIHTPLPIFPGNPFKGVVISSSNDMFPVDLGFYGKDGSVSFQVSMPIVFQGTFNGSTEISGKMPSPGSHDLKKKKLFPDEDGNWSATAQPTEEEG
ncbi:MAG TPA: hypothetical protein VF297_01455 [Pyrinomonadaceae bacterium]